MPEADEKRYGDWTLWTGGISTPIWVHETCPYADRPAGGAEVEEFPVEEIRIDDKSVEVVYRLVCADCNHEGNISMRLFDPTDEWWLEAEKKYDNGEEIEVIF